MDTSNKQTIACYIDSNKILFYLGEIGSILALEFPPEILSYLDILHKDKFEQLIESFLEQNNLAGGSAVLIFSPSVAFEKEFQESEVGKEETEIQKFIDMVPFEDILSKTYKLDKKIKVVAVNNRVYESIKAILEKRNFLIYAVIPGCVLQETFPELAENIDLGFILKKIDSLKQYNMINGSVGSNQTLEKKPESKKQFKRIYALAGVFGILFLILIILIIVSISPKPTVKPSGQIGTPPFSPKPTALETSRNGTIPKTTESSSTPSGSTLPIK